MLKSIKKLAFVIILLFLKSCSLQKGYVLYQEKPDEILTTQELKDYVSKNPNLTIVVRAPNSSNQMTEDDQNGQLYNIIEKELLRVDFNIKDRALFNRVIDNNKALSYNEIHELTKTDLILELTHLNNSVKYNTNVIYNSKNEKIIYDNYNITRVGASIEFKIIDLKENRMIGSYTFNYSPCTENNNDCRCSVAYKNDDLHPYYNYCQNGEIIAYESIERNTLNEFVKIGIREFINQIKN